MDSGRLGFDSRAGQQAPRSEEGRPVEGRARGEGSTTRQALSDIEESAVFIGADSTAAALRFLDAMEEALRLLVENPELGHARTFERSLVGFRSFPVKGFDKHLIFYRPTRKGIEVLRVLHGARDLCALSTSRSTPNP